MVAQFVLSVSLEFILGKWELGKSNKMESHVFCASFLQDMPLHHIFVLLSFQ